MLRKQKYKQNFIEKYTYYIRDMKTDRNEIFLIKS